MSTPKILSLGVHTIQFGVKNDSERIKKMVTCPHWLGQLLDPDRFANKGELTRNGTGIDNWPEGPKEAELFAVCFEKWLPNFEAVQVEASYLLYDHASLKLAMFPHLATQLFDEKLAWLWKHEIPSLAPMNTNSLLRTVNNNLDVPYADCYPPCPGLRSHWVENGWDKYSFFLFFRPMDIRAGIQIEVLPEDNLLLPDNMELIAEESVTESDGPTTLKFHKFLKQDDDRMNCEQALKWAVETGNRAGLRSMRALLRQQGDNRTEWDDEEYFFFTGTVASDQDGYHYVPYFFTHRGTFHPDWLIMSNQDIGPTAFSMHRANK